MGKQPPPYHQHQCGDDAPICGCNLSDVKYDDCTPTPCDDHTKLSEDENIHDLLVVGAGPHAHALLLRLLSPDPDFLSEKERHKQAEFKERMRPPRDVNAYLRKLSRGPKATLKPSRKNKNKKKGTLPDTTSPPPPLTLEEIHKSVLIVDKYGTWMKGWKDNFSALKIRKLRSLMSAHNCPFDHRSLEYYAEMKHRGDELITLPNLNQRDQAFKGPYQVGKRFNKFYS